MLHVLSTREWHGSGGAAAAAAAAAVEALALAGRGSLEELVEGWEEALRGGWCCC